MNPFQRSQLPKGTRPDSIWRGFDESSGQSTKQPKSTSWLQKAPKALPATLSAPTDNTVTKINRPPSKSLPVKSVAMKSQPRKSHVNTANIVSGVKNDIVTISRQSHLETQRNSHQQRHPQQASVNKQTNDEQQRNDHFYSLLNTLKAQEKNQNAGKSQASKRKMPFEGGSDKKTKIVNEADYSKLSDEQKNILNLVVEQQKNVFFTGNAGTLFQ